MSDSMREIRSVVREARIGAQGAFSEGVEAMISEMRRFAVAAEKAIGEISIDEAFHGVARVVNERVEQLTGKPVEALSAPQPAAGDAALREALTWRPMETAPKDGTKALIYFHDSDRWLVGIGWWGDITQSWLVTNIGPVQPTHWMPLPEPPSS